MLVWGPGLLDWTIVAKGYILLLASSSPWRLHPANQNSKVFIHSVACSRASSPDLVLKNRRPEPPAGNSGAHRGRGLTAFLCFAPPGARGPLAGSEVSLPLGLALGSPIFPSGCEGKLGVALESLQGKRDLI